MPPGEPTVLNKERAGQCDDVLRHGTRLARGRSSWQSQTGIALGRLGVPVMANRCESAQGSSRANESARPGQGLTGSDPTVRWQESRPNDRGSRLSTTRSTCGCLRPRTPKVEHVKPLLARPVSPPGEARARSFLPDRRVGEMARIVPARYESFQTSRPRGTPKEVQERMLEEANAGL